MATDRSRPLVRRLGLRSGALREAYADESEHRRAGTDLALGADVETATDRSPDQDRAIDLDGPLQTIARPGEQGGQVDERERMAPVRA